MLFKVHLAAILHHKKNTMPTNHFISLDEAVRMTKLFKNKKEEILSDDYKGRDILPTCETFDRTAFDTLLAQPGCEKIRIYLGMDEEDKIRLVIVGADARDEDMLPSLESGTNNIVEEGMRCPDICPPPSILNGF